MLAAAIGRVVVGALPEEEAVAQAQEADEERQRELAADEELAVLGACYQAGRLAIWRRSR